MAMLDGPLDREQMLRYLGYRGQPLDAALLAQLARCEDAVSAAAEPRVVWRELAYEAVPAPLLQGRDVRAHLRGCDRVLLLAATLGAGVDRLLLRAQVTSLADAAIMDAAASAAIEQVCDRWEADRRAALARQGLGLTGRFSPGYGDLPLSAQPLLLDAVDAGRRIGLRLTGGGLMTPRKSVTALLGVGPGGEPARGCGACALRTSCEYRQGGNHCGR